MAACLAEVVDPVGDHNTVVVVEKVLSLPNLLVVAVAVVVVGAAVVVVVVVDSFDHLS